MLCARARPRDRWRCRVELDFLLSCRLAGCSVTCACCLLTGLPARLGVLCGLLLLRTSVDRQLVLGLVWAPQVDFPTRALRLICMAAVSEITIVRAGFVFYGIESRRLFDAGLWTPCFVWDSLVCVLVIPSDSRLFGMMLELSHGYCFTGHR